MLTICYRDLGGPWLTSVLWQAIQRDAYRKVRFKGLANNTALLFSLFCYANLVLARQGGYVMLSAELRPENEK
jgi:IS5 family transposase